jgi:hypothetical protein
LIPDEFKNDTDAKALANKVIYPKPEKLHEQHQQRNKEGGYEGTNKCFNDEYI